MTNNINNTSGQQVRIPNLPVGPIVDANGMPTGEELTFRQALLSLLEQFMGTEGLVMPGQTTSDINTIVANTNNTEGATGTVYTCNPGTFLYDTTDNSIKVTVMSGGQPMVKTVTIT